MMIRHKIFRAQRMHNSKAHKNEIKDTFVYLKKSYVHLKRIMTFN